MENLDYNSKAELEIRSANKEMEPGLIKSFFSSRDARLDTAEEHFNKAVNYLKLSKNCKITRSMISRSKIKFDLNLQVKKRQVR